MRAASTALVWAVLLFLGRETRGEPLTPLITNLTVPTSAAVGSVATFSVVASTNVGALSYQWDFGDGQSTGFLETNNGVTHSYAAPGHYTVTVTVREPGTPPTTATDTRKIVAFNPLTTPQPTNSSSILFDSSTGKVWVANVDQDTVSSVDTANGNAVASFEVGKTPRTLARAGDGRIWVVSQQHPSISILHPGTGALEHVVPLPHGSLPYGICMTPDGSAAYVSFQGRGGVFKISTATRQVLASATEPPAARGIAVSGDGRVLVTRFISPVVNSLSANQTSGHGEVVELNGATLAVVRTFILAHDPGLGSTAPDPDTSSPPTAITSRGVPNYITSLVITPDGRRAWIPSKKDNVQRGTSTVRDGRTPGAEFAYRAIVSSLDLVNNVEPDLSLPATRERIDIDDGEMPQAACTSPKGDFLFIGLQGNNTVQIRDLYNMSSPMNLTGDSTGPGTSGLSPQGLVIDPATEKLYVHNYMGRSVSIFNVAPILSLTATSLGAPTVVTLVPVVNDKLNVGPVNQTVLRGKQVFYNSSDPRMSRLNYISCAGCHLDGAADMRVWDFTNRGEGLRNTVVLQGRSGTGHGNVHWSANFDEIQDFDNDAYFHFHAGNPVPPIGPPGPVNSSFTTSPNHPMAAGNTGRDDDLDAMANYVASLTKVSRSPFRNPDGTLTAQGAAGEAVFKARNCQRCHTGSRFTDSTVGNNVPVVDPVGPVAPNTPILHDVGTIKDTSGHRLGDVLPLPGVDTPTLKGIWQSAPYLHDGSAGTLEEVFNVVGAEATKHLGGVLTALEQADLVRYMIEIDEIDAPPVDPAQVNTVSLTSVSTGRPYSLARAAQNRLPFVDRSYQITALSGNLDGAILLRTAEDDKNVSASTHVVLTFSNPGLTWKVYVCYDARQTSLPAWLSGSAPSGETISVSHLPLGMVVRELDVLAPGTLILGGNLASGASGALRNYFVIIRTMTGVNEAFEEGPLSQSEWVHDQDADGDGLRDEFEAVTAARVAGLSPWVADSAVPNEADEDRVVGGHTLFEKLQSFNTGGGGSGGGGGGCGFAGFEFLLPLALFRLLKRRRA